MEEPNSKKKKTHPIHQIIDKVLPYLTDPDDRASASMVCRSWKKADGETREHVTMALCYAASPARLSRRFPNLKHLKVKGNPRAAMFSLVPDNWGGYATPWVNEIAISKFQSLKSIHFRRMIVSDLDLDVLAKARLDQLVALKLDRCSGFSTDGLLSITKHCRKIETLLLDKSLILENDGAWLHELALHNTSLKVLNFYVAGLNKIKAQDMEILATKCRSLVSVKMGNFDILGLNRFFRAATNLEEFFGGSFIAENGRPNKYRDMYFSPKLCRLGIIYIRELDLTYTWLNTDDHCTLLAVCRNLEVLTTKNVIRDEGLHVLAQHCKKLKRLKIIGLVNGKAMVVGGFVTHIGLISVAQGCKELECISVHISGINNNSLQIIGNSLENLCDFRVVLISNGVMELPLDSGVRDLLRG